MMDLIPEREQEIRDFLAGREEIHALSFIQVARDLLAALDAERARNRELEQRIHRQRIELAAANDENRRGNEFARRAAEARCADLQAVAEAAREETQ